MCGFAGYINFDQETLDFKVLKEMTDIQQHRGPDSQGFVGFSLFNKSLPNSLSSQDDVKNCFHGGIGFNRLSVIDLSSNGHQPMISNCGEYLIAYNGETYNAFNYRDDLVKKYNFRSNTDTEIILNLYIEFGIDKTLELLNGMFAFTIIDFKKQVCYMARDHFGIKPIYIYESKNTILFSSEIKSFTKHPSFKAELNNDSLDEYLLFKYCAHDRSLLRNVRQIPPAHYYKITNDEKKFYKYWNAENNKINNSITIENLDHKLDDILKNSIKSQLLSDVKVGCQLSGGIDSSLVTAYARNYFQANMDTFSIVFSDKNYSEEKWIDYVAGLTESQSHKIDFTSKYFIENLCSSTWHLDQPISIPNTLGIKKMAEESGKEVTVLLSGEGADEIFGGYSRYHDLSFRVSNNLTLLKYLPHLGKKFQNKYRLDISPQDFFILSGSSMDFRTFRNFSLTGDLNKALSERRSLYPASKDFIKNASIYDMRTSMVDLLNRQDKMTMAHSVENRVPFLDRELVDHVLQTPSQFLVKKCNKIWNYNSPNIYTKYILKQIATKRFNNKFVYRAKSGFPLPLKEIFFKSLMNQFIEDSLLPGMKDRGIFDYETVMKIWEKKENHLTSADIKNLWMLFSFEIWAQIFLD